MSGLVSRRHSACSAIETHELSKRYRRVSALTECTVTVPAGRVSALVGPNGAGKTTLLRILIVLSCMQAHGWRGFATYQPASRYWPFQGIETGIYVLLAAALIAVTFVIVRRRDA